MQLCYATDRILPWRWLRKLYWQFPALGQASFSFVLEDLHGEHSTFDNYAATSEDIAFRTSCSSTRMKKTWWTWWIHVNSTCEILGKSYLTILSRIERSTLNLKRDQLSTNQMKRYGELLGGFPGSLAWLSICPFGVPDLGKARNENAFSGI